MWGWRPAAEAAIGPRSSARVAGTAELRGWRRRRAPAEDAEDAEGAEQAEDGEAREAGEGEGREGHQDDGQVEAGPAGDAGRERDGVVSNVLKV